MPQTKVTTRTFPSKPLLPSLCGWYPSPLRSLPDPSPLSPPAHSSRSLGLASPPPKCLSPHPPAQVGPSPRGCGPAHQSLLHATSRLTSPTHSTCKELPLILRLRTEAPPGSRGPVRPADSHLLQKHVAGSHRHTFHPLLSPCLLPVCPPFCLCLPRPWTLGNPACHRSPS